jgi:hypothetical protein
MASDFPTNDPRTVWQNQPKEPFKMSIEELRSKAERRQKKARLEVILSIAIGFILCVIFAWTFVKVHEMVPRLGWAVLSLWSIYFAYQAYRWIWPGRLAPNATVSTSLEFYRHELENQRDHARHVWRRSGLTFCFLGLGLTIVPELIYSHDIAHLPGNVGPLVVLLIMWAVAFSYLRKRRQRRLQQEIEELREFEREN